MGHKSEEEEFKRKSDISGRLARQEDTKYETQDTRPEMAQHGRPESTKLGEKKRKTFDRIHGIRSQM